MAGDTGVFKEDSVKSLISSFCESIIKQEEQLETDRWQSKLLSVPNYLQAEAFRNRDKAKQHLFKTTYDLLLLRKSSWYNKWQSPLTPECRCLAYGYQLKQHGRNEEADRLIQLIDSDSIASYTHSNNVLTFLAILSNQQTITHKKTALMDDSTYAVYPNDVFEALPGSVTLQYQNDKFFTRSPGTGLMGFCTQEDLRGDLQSHDSTLFSGLTHTTTPTVNTTLHIPSLTNQPPPDMLDRFLNRHSHTNPPPLLDSMNDSGIQCDSVIDLIDKVGVIGEAPPTSWEGQLEHITRPYLSEAGSDAFYYSADAFLSITAETGGLKATPTAPPYSLTRNRSLDSVTLFMNVLKKCETIIDSMRSYKFADSISKNYFDCVCSILNVCRVRVDQLQAEKECSEFYIQLKAKGTRRLVGFAEQLLSLCVKQPINGRDILNRLYRLCLNNEGLPTYRLMLGVWLHSLEPYLSGIEVWAYSGQNLNILGLVRDDVALEARDHTYWIRAFTFNPGDVPDCFVKLAQDILNIGRSLNLLNLICPKHHLCNGKHHTPRLAFVETLQELTENMKIFAEYKQSMELLEELHKEQKRADIEKERMLAMEPIVRARREAQQYMDDIKRRELEELNINKEEKRALLMEQMKDIERSRAYQIEMEAIEREEESLIMEDQQATTKEKELMEELKGDLIDYYQRLSRGAELRRARAKWRAKRFAIATARLQRPDIEDIEEDHEDLVGSRSTGSDNIMTVGSDEALEGTDTESTEPYGVAPDRSPNESIEEPIIIESMTEPLIVEGGGDQEEVPPIVDRPHPSQSTVQDLLYSGEVVESTSTVTSRGDAPVSTIQEIMYPNMENKIEKGDEPVQGEESGGGGYKEEASERTNTRGEVPPSTIKDILYPNMGYEIEKEDVPIMIKGSVLEYDEDLPEKTNTRGEAPLSTIQEIMYPVSVVEDSLEGEGGGTPMESSISEELESVEGSHEERSVEGSHFSPDHIPSHDEDDTKLLQPYKRYFLDLSLGSSLPYTDILNAPPTSSDPALLLCSLDTLIDLCLVQPITIQADLVNKALINYFINELDIKGHFRNLKDFLFLEDGEFSSVLLSSLFEKLVYDVSSMEISSISFLQPLLMSALDQSHSNNLIPILELKARRQPSVIQSTSIKALSFLQVLYKVDWPMNIVIQRHHVNQYNDVFHFMLEIKRCSWLLKHVFLKLAKGCHSISSIQLRLIHAQRQELQHFVTVMESYVTNQIFHVSWKSFESNIDEVSSLDDLIRCHDDYLKEVLSKCLLIKKTQSVLNLIEECLACVIKFAAQFLSSDQFKPSVLSTVYKKFRSISSLLLKVISKLIERGYQPHLEDLLLRMNFNKYYIKNIN